MSRLEALHQIPQPPDAPDPLSVDIDGRRLPLTLRSHPRARRISIRVKTATGEVAVVRPQWVSDREALAFAQDQAGWILARLDAVPEGVAFAPGASIPLRDIPYRIENVPAQIRRVEAEDGERILRVSGPPQQIAERLTVWLRRQARSDVLQRVQYHAPRVGKPVPRITIRDTASRWGSCSERSGLSFSWRLVLAPPPVLDYVVAHECAHLVHMNHGPNFWSLVGTLVENVDSAEAWLKRHGPQLHRYGRATIAKATGSSEAPASF